MPSSRKWNLIIAKIEGQVNFITGWSELQAMHIRRETSADRCFCRDGSGHPCSELSNGTLMTMRENTRMKIGEFKQAPFDPGNRNYPICRRAKHI